MVGIDYTYILFFLGGGIFMVAAALIFAWILRPSKPDPIKESVYECGEEAVGSSMVQFNIRFYLAAILFVIFDVEALFLLPWAVAFRDLGFFAFIEMILFIAILFVGLAYAWRKGILKWV
ncbi:MAG: NADH-quinone oxidoreductase subunit A [Candidatus Eremiobacteraeota bacterium]|nr:NADH-quinone oxidoreductase subunit A [Candidatus Eremiobacteraeota bacterium]